MAAVINKEVLAKAIILVMKDNVEVISKKIEASVDMREIARLYRELADMIDDTQDQILELEENDDIS